MTFEITNKKKIYVVYTPNTHTHLDLRSFSHSLSPPYTYKHTHKPDLIHVYLRCFANPLIHEKCTLSSTHTPKHAYTQSDTCSITHIVSPPLLSINPLMPSGSFNICCPRYCVSRTANEKLVTIVANRH